jgi:hypothetical protein
MIVGKIKKIKLGVVTFDPDDVADITVKVKDLKSLSAFSKIFRIETVQHQVYFGNLAPHDKKGYVQLGNSADTGHIFLQDISVMYPYDRSFMQRFSGNAGLGYNYTRSSNFGRLNFDGVINYFSQKEEVSLSLSGIYTMTDTSFSRDNETASFKYNYYFNPTWFGTAFLGYQRNLELGLERRHQQGLGGGNKFITSKYVYAWARGGVVLNEEKSTEDVTTGILTEVFGQIQFNFFRFTVPKVEIDLSQSLYYNLSQNGRFRNDGEMDINWEIIRDLRLNLGFYHNYDSKPPVEGGSNLDFGVLFGLNYKFY